MPYKFSPSSLSLLNDCKRCFWLRFNKNIRRPEGIFPSLPSGMDKILKIHFDSFLKKDNLPPELNELEGEVTLYDNKTLLETWRNNRKGIRWEDEHGNLFMGAIDNILKKGNKLIILDYKTRGYPLKENTHEYYQNQLDIYNLLFRKNKYDTEDYSYLLFYHPTEVNDSGDIVFHTDLIKLKVSINNAAKIFHEALELLNLDIPIAAKNCNYCNWISENSNI